MKKYWFAILLFALMIRLGAAFYWEKRTETLSGNANAIETKDAAASEETDGPFFFGDSDSYWKLGRTLAFGRPYRFDPQRNWTIFRMPGYPALLAPLFWLGGEHPPILWGRIENALFGVLTVLLTGLLGRFLFRDERVGLLAAAFAAIDPSLVVQSVLILSEEPFTAALLAQLLLITAILRSVSSENIPAPQGAARSERFFALGGLLGLLSALTVYLRPNWLWFVPFALIFLLFDALIRRRMRGVEFHGVDYKDVAVQKFDYRGMALILMIGFLAFSFGMSPWWLRNQRVAGQFIPTTLQMGASLYDGLSPEADGSSDMRFVDRFRAEVAAESSDDPTKRAHFEVRLDERMKRASLDWVRQNPGEAMRLAGVKCARLWNLWPNEPSFSAPMIRLVLVFSCGPIFLLALCGLIRSFRENAAARLLLIPALYITAQHIIFVSSIRYRIPITPPLMILAAWGLLGWIKKRDNKK